MIIVTAALILRGDRILIARRHRGDPLDGLWEFPGGKLEAGETPEQCLKRELREEFGIEARVGDFFMSNQHRYPHLAIELLAYWAEHLSGEFRLSDHDAIEWARFPDLARYAFAPADIPIVERLRGA
jgi:8-oxo-dGTP diphosphatase